MGRFRFGVMLLALPWLAVPPVAGAANKFALQALFKDKAIIVIDGARRVLKTGDTSPEGVKLVATDTREETATVAMDGKTQVLRLGTVVTATTTGGKGLVTLYTGGGAHFYADGYLNDAAVKFLVDTGATIVAINSHDAERAGIDYKRTGKQEVVATASGMARSYAVKIARVKVGEITLHHVDGSVIEGRFPLQPLLGMSFLGQLDMRHENDKLELRQR
jgi:aspartyl protease family protein